MSAKQDRQGVRTASDLERKYSLGQSVTKGYVQSTVKSSIAIATSEIERYVDTKLETSQKDIAKLEQSVSDLEDAISGLEPSGGEGSMIVTVEADSLSTEVLTSDKTFSEIEASILAGKNVIVKLLCSNVEHHIYMQLTAHLHGSLVEFTGFFNKAPLLLQITSDNAT